MTKRSKILIFCIFTMLYCLVAQSCLTVTPWTVAHQAPLSMEFPRQEYWNGLAFPSPGYLHNPGTEPESPALTGGFLTTEATREAPGETGRAPKLSGCLLKSALGIMLLSRIHPPPWMLGVRGPTVSGSRHRLLNCFPTWAAKALSILSRL